MEESKHKRSKSARVMNLIRTHSHRGGGGSGAESADEASPIDSSPLTSSPDNNRLTPVNTNMTTTSNPSITTDQAAPRLAAEEIKKQPSTGLSTTPSIEDSIRTFKVFEALRSKDSAAVTRAIQECSPTPSTPQPVSGTTILHLAIQCADPNVVDQVIDQARGLDLNTQDRDGNTPLHLAAQLGRTHVVTRLLENPDVNDALVNRAGKTPLDLARTPEIFSQLQLARSLFMDQVVKKMHDAVSQKDYKRVEDMLTDSKISALLDVNALELPTDQATIATGGTLLHEAARHRDLHLAQLLLLHGADPFRRDRGGKLPQDVTKDEKTRAILKKSPAAAVAQRGVQEKAILGSTPGVTLDSAGKESREMKGYLKKWTNYTSGYKLRWFVLEDGVMSYYKHQDDAGSACRGAINMRIARLHMDPSDKTRFEIIGKSSVKYHLKANHVVEAKRWFWALNNAIQHTKDEAKMSSPVEVAPSIRGQQSDQESLHSRPARLTGSHLNVALAPSAASVRSHNAAASTHDADQSSFMGDEIYHVSTVDGEGDDEVERDDVSSHDGHHGQDVKDAFNITAQSAKLQLDLLSRVSGALNSKQTLAPNTVISDPDVASAFATYENAVSSLQGLVTDLLKIARDREAYWQFRLERDADARRMWEESMAAIAYEHEDLKKTIAESEDKRKRTKRALKQALEGQTEIDPVIAAEARDSFAPQTVPELLNIRPEARRAGARRQSVVKEGARRKSVIAQYTNISDSESGDDDEFFDAIDAGEIEIIALPAVSVSPVHVESAPRRPEEDKALPTPPADPRSQKKQHIEPSYQGYEDGVRKKLKLDADNRPKIGLWGILKSMIGKDMTKMTLPVSFNEPTSLLYRVTEDMEYADLLDIAADRDDSLERMVYVAAFATSEYASTIGRVAKPFNPLLGETYEYVRPDKGYRFFAQQVSHHPPIGAAYAESARWDYYGESAVKTKFAGKSFDAYPLGTWFCELRLKNGRTELYSWKKVVTTVIGIITGNPTIDNYGPMEVKNWSTGEVCLMNFKQRGWTASSAYMVSGKITDKRGITKWSIGGRWNEKLYARQTEGYEDENVGEAKGKSANQALLVWQANPRPTGIPFNLTPFAVTFNDDNPKIMAKVAPTDSRRRPDQRAMEDGEYDFAATEKNRLEEKQRAARRQRESAGEIYASKYFGQKKHPVTGELYWEFNGQYWKKREVGDWNGADDIF